MKNIHLNQGFTIIELMLGIGILSLLAVISVPIFAGYVERMENQQAVNDMQWIDAKIVKFQSDSGGAFPDTLAEAMNPVPTDPWGNPFVYLRINGGSATPGQLRKDHNLVPINSDYDLYSKGPDGRSVAPLTAAHSRDDIVRANNGAYVGKASEY